MTTTAPARGASSWLGARLRNSLSTHPAQNLAFIIVLAIVLWRIPYSLSNVYQLRIATLLVIYALFTTGLEFAMGRAGQVSLGHGGIFAIGAYTEGILQTKHNVGPWMAFFAAIAVGALAGLVMGLPALRVRGPYLAVVTIGFGLTVQALLYVFPQWTNGASGIAGTKHLGSVGFGGGALGTYYGALLALAISLALLTALTWGRLGQALAAMSESVTLAAASGVSVRALKLAMFAVSAAVAAAAGACFGTLGYISPDSFSLQMSIFPVVALVLGGIGTVPGPVLGAFLLYGFNQFADRTPQGSALMYGILLMVVPLVLSRGLAGLVISGARRLRRAPRRGSASTGARFIGAPPTQAPPVATQGPTAGLSLELRNACRYFGNLKAVDDVSMSVRPGEVVGLVGPNGSGKSTLLNLVSGYYSFTRGALILDGRDVTRTPFHKRVRQGALTAFQSAQLMNSGSVRDNLALGGVVKSRWGRPLAEDRIATMMAALDRSVSLETTVGTLSEGSRKVVELGRTLLAEPRLLLLDEPTSGLSLEEVDRVVALINGIKDSGVTILLADHNFEFVGAVCERLVVLESGRVLAEGSVDDLRNDERVIAAYLGGRMTAGGEQHAAGA